MCTCPPVDNSDWSRWRAVDPWSRYASPQAPLASTPRRSPANQAEALANQTSSPLRRLRSTRNTDCAGGRGLDDPKACLPPLSGQLTQAQLVTEIYLQRRYELLGTGLRWEDARRRNAVRGPTAAPGVPTDGQRCWLPYAIGDRNANPNATFAALPDPIEPSAFPSGCTL